MHAKIILLPGSQTGERLCSVAEEILTDISVSFGHTFSILRDKIGEASERLCCHIYHSLCPICIGRI